MRKKLLAFVLCCSLASTALVGCGGSDDKKETKKTETSADKTADKTTSSSDAASSSSQDTSSDAASDDSAGMIQVPVAIQNMLPDIPITELYVSSAGLDEWGDELLQGRTIDSGEQLTDIVFNVSANDLKWDLMATDQEGTSVEFRDLDISECSTDGLTIKLQVDDDGNPIATAE